MVAMHLDTIGNERKKAEVRSTIICIKNYDSHPTVHSIGIAWISPLHGEANHTQQMTLGSNAKAV